MPAVAILGVPVVIAVAVLQRRWHAHRKGPWVTNATWTRRGDKVLHPLGRARRWHYLPVWTRAGVEAGAWTAGLATVYGLIVARTVTVVLLCAAAAAALGYGGWRACRAIRRWRHYRTWERPLHRALAAELGAPPARLAVERDRSKVIAVLPEEFTASDRDRDAITRAVTAKLALEAPDADWSKLTGRRPQVTFTRSQPPPPRVRWGDIEQAVMAAGPSQLVTGIGKKDTIVSVSTELDSPHFLLAMGSGGGKSNTAAFWLVQALMKGDIGLFLDAKYISHPWTFKDMDAGYGQLPNVAYARTTEALHYAMVWLGVELQRRTEAAEKAVNARGEILADVGPRLWIVAEEMNLATPRLKQYWAEIRDKDDPKRSPALDGLAAVAFAGRAVKMHLITIGQMLTAASLGGGDVRENMGVRVLARYTANSWKMQAGDLPMPPSPEVPGRVQVVTGGAVREAQVPLLDLAHCRELALSGAVSRCPADMPGITAGSDVLGLTSGYPGPELRDVLDPGGCPGRPPGTLTLREATREGLFRSVDAARKAVQRRAIEPARNPDGEPARDGNANLYYLADLAKTLRRTQ